MVENYWLDFCAWKDITGYNEIALVGMFRDRLNTSLACKLVEIGGINKGLTLKEQYLKAVKFKKARQVIKGIFRKQTIKPSKLASRIEDKLIHKTRECNALVKDSNFMDINMIKR